MFSAYYWYIYVEPFCLNQLCHMAIFGLNTAAFIIFPLLRCKSTQLAPYVRLYYRLSVSFFEFEKISSVVHIYHISDNKK